MDFVKAGLLYSYLILYNIRANDDNGITGSYDGISMNHNFSFTSHKTTHQANNDPPHFPIPAI